MKKHPSNGELSEEYRVQVQNNIGDEKQKISLKKNSAHNPQSIIAETSRRRRQGRRFM